MVGAMARVASLAIVLLLTASLASALDDNCRAGASALGDRRALADLRAAIDADCGCAEPAGGIARKAFVRCARSQAAQMLHDGALRRACLSTADSDIRRATCGTNRVACGEVDELEQPGCRLAAPAG